MNTELLWEHALNYLMATDSNPSETLERWRSERPEACDNRDLLREYAWVVGSCGLTPQVMERLWARLTTAFLDWDTGEVAGRAIEVRAAALGVIRNQRKIEAILTRADDLARHPGEMQRLATLPVDHVLAQLSTLPWVGSTNRYHLARNLGWDVVVRTGAVPRLAGLLETTPEALCARIVAHTGERIRTVDLVLWNWGHQVGDTAMREFTSLVRFT